VRSIILRVKRMCLRVACKNCGRPTYTGSGKHMELVLRDVSKEQRCKCREKKMEKFKVGHQVLAKHPFSAEMEKGVVMDIRARDEEVGRGPFYLVRFNKADDKNRHTAYTRNPIIRRWVRMQDIESIE